MNEEVLKFILFLIFALGFYGFLIGSLILMIRQKSSNYIFILIAFVANLDFFLDATRNTVDYIVLAVSIVILVYTYFNLLRHKRTKDQGVKNEKS